MTDRALMTLSVFLRRGVRGTGRAWTRNTEMTSKKMLAYVGAGVLALSASVFATVLIRTDGSTAKAGGRAEAAAVGFSVIFDGEKVSDDVMGGAVIQQQAAAKAIHPEWSEQDVADLAVAQVAFGQSLIEVGRESGSPVTDDEITKFMLSMDSFIDVSDSAKAPADAGGLKPSEVVDNPLYRDAAKAILYRNRGLGIITGAGNTPADPNVTASVASWFARAIEEHHITAATPFGEVRADRLIDLSGPAPTGAEGVSVSPQVVTPR